LLDRMNATIEELTAAVEREARKRPEAMRLMTHPGVGALTALAYVLIIGTPTRFERGKQIGTYVGMIPCEESSARKQRLGHISKRQFVVALLAGGGGPSGIRKDPGFAKGDRHLRLL
jgi:transposase